MIPKPTEDTAMQFALMVKAGLPPKDAILYFASGEEDIREVLDAVQAWMKSSYVKKATLKLMGKPWQDMSIDEQIKAALDNTYSGMAYFLFTVNYSEMGPSDKAKHDTARQALEAKMAGTAGQGTPMEMFFSDLRSGKVKLAGQAAKLPPFPLPESH